MPRGHFGLTNFGLGVFFSMIPPKRPGACSAFAFYIISSIGLKREEQVCEPRYKKQIVWEWRGQIVVVVFSSRLQGQEKAARPTRPFPPQIKNLIILDSFLRKHISDIDCRVPINPRKKKAIGRRSLPLFTGSLLYPSTQPADHKRLIACTLPPRIMCHNSRQQNHPKS